MRNCEYMAPPATATVRPSSAWASAGRAGGHDDARALVSGGQRHVDPGGDAGAHLGGDIEQDRAVL